MSRIYARFEELSRRLHEFDASLHMSLTVYTKPGQWKEGPEFCARNLTTL